MDKQVFLSANTAEGSINFFNLIVEMYDLNKLYILKGGSGIGKSTFMRNFSNAFDGKKTFVYCSADPNSLDGVILEDLGVAIIDGTAPHIVDPRFPGLIDEIVDLGKFIIPDRVRATVKQINDITQNKKKHYQNAFAELKMAREQHQELERLYSGAVDFEKVDELCNKLITETKLTAGVTKRNSEGENPTR